MDYEKKIVSKKWSSLEPKVEKNFFGFPPLRPHLIKSAFGKELAQKHKNNRFWAEDIAVQEYLKDRKINSIMSLCCGFGFVEQHILSELSDVTHCLAVDLAEGAVNVARERAAKAGLGDRIEYKCADLNTFNWPKNKYDLIIANGALHHLSDLEKVLEGIKGALTNGGILYANEHVGASLQDYPVRQLELINAAAHLMLPELRSVTGTPFRHSHRYLMFLYRILGIPTGRTQLPDPDKHPEWSDKKKLIISLLRKIIKTCKNPISDKFYFGIIHDSQKKYLLRTDPSEGVRSSEIIPLIKHYFNNNSVDVRSYGGAILAYCLDSKFYDNYDNYNKSHRDALEILCQLESSLTESGMLGIEYAIIFAQKQQ